MRLALFCLLVAIAGCASDRPRPQAGGECTYDRHEGTCTVTRLSLFTEFTFEGKVAGGELSLAGNTVETAASKLPRAVGESAPCTLEWLTSGGCTPCTVGGGTCGPDAQKLVPPGRTPAR